MGSYRIVKKLAAGGMSEVFLGQEWRPEGPGRMVALKRLLPMYQRDESQVEQFLREARVCQGFRHPNVVPVLDTGASEGRLYTVMEFVEGENLNALLRAQRQRNERPRLAEACYVVRQVAEGLAYAHTLRAPSGEPLGLIHRDINPSNVLLSRTGEVKLVDFGIAKVADGSRDTQAGLIKGKLRYLSPEQARGERLDQRCDVFLLGVLLYELLTGRHLFHGTDLELLRQITRFDEQRLEPIPWIPQPLWRVLLRTLAASRLVRMGTARELADTLSALLEDWGMSLGSADMARVFARCFPGWDSPLQGTHEPHDALVCLKNHAPPLLSEEPLAKTRTSVLPLARRIPVLPEEPFSLLVDVCEEVETRASVPPSPPRMQPEPGGRPPVPSLPPRGEVLVASQPRTVGLLEETLTMRRPRDAHSRVDERLRTMDVPRTLLQRLPEELCERLCVVPVFMPGARELVCAMRDPHNLEVLDALRFATGVRTVRGLHASESAIRQAIHRFYGGSGPETGTSRERPQVLLEPAPSWLHLPLLEALTSEVSEVLLHDTSNAHPERDDAPALGLLG